MSKKVSEIIVDTLQQAGAKRCYGIVGDTINHFTDAIHESSIRWVHMRHEEAGGLAAGGEAYMTGELALCAGTCGPGSLHFVNGIFESHRNGAPVVLVASDVARAESGLDFPQEVDQRKVYEQTSVFCEYISDPSQARRVTALAAQAALTKKGVAVIIVNGDMFTQTDEDALPWSVHRPKSILIPEDDAMAQLSNKINAAKSVTIYAGIGARNAHDDIVELANKLKAPVVHSSRAKEFIEPHNDFNVGMTGILGNRAGMDAVKDADLTLCLGTGFAWTQFYPGAEHIVQIDNDPTQLGKRAPVGLGLVGDIKDTVAALNKLVDDKTDNQHLDKALKQWQKDQQAYADYANDKSDELLHPQYVTRMLDQLAADDAMFTADGGSPMAWLLRHLTANGKRRFLTSLMHGTMANAYPQALGMAAAYPDRQIIAMSGDGGLTMLMGDMLTAVQEKLPIKILLFNNGSLGFVEMEQRVEGLLDTFTELQSPDFVKLCEACHVEAWSVDKNHDLEPAMQAWLAAEGPALLDVRVNRLELVMPPKVEPSQVASTALFGLKAVANGRTGEFVDLLRDNFLR